MSEQMIRRALVVVSPDRVSAQMRQALAAAGLPAPEDLQVIGVTQADFGWGFLVTSERIPESNPLTGSIPVLASLLTPVTLEEAAAPAEPEPDAAPASDPA
jgi:hypothetical protein